MFFVYLNENATNSSSVILYAELELVGYCLFVLFVYLLGFFGYKQGSIFSHRIVYSNFDEHGDDEERVELKVKNLNRTNFSTQKKEEAFVDILNKFMMEQKPYFNSELTLSQLANELNVSTHYLSNILNNYIHKNFYEFINNYRVDEVKKRIISHRNSNFTILAIALDCGFNSKATFNRIFKNYTGNTPSQFQKEYR